MRKIVRVAKLYCWAENVTKRHVVVSRKSTDIQETRTLRSWLKTTHNKTYVLTTNAKPITFVLKVKAKVKAHAIAESKRCQDYGANSSTILLLRCIYCLSLCLELAIILAQ